MCQYVLPLTYYLRRALLKFKCTEFIKTYIEGSHNFSRNVLELDCKTSTGQNAPKFGLNTI